MKGLLVILMMLMCIFAYAAEEPDWEFLQHYAVGVAWEIGNGEEHSLAFASVVTYKELYNLDAGLIDWEQVETSGERWYNDLKPIVGVSVDVFGVIEQVPQLEPIVGWIPDCVGAGVGVHIEVEADHDVIPMAYITASW